MQSGDLITWNDHRSEPHTWRILGVYLGALGHESLVEIEPVSHEPGRSGKYRTHPVMFVPECLLRDLAERNRWDETIARNREDQEA